MEKYKNPWTVLSSKEVHDTPWVTVTAHDVLTPNNTPGHYTVTRFKGWAIGIVPLDEEYNTWIVGQWRFPTDSYSWEIPEGGGDKNVPPLDSAKRELSEETGIKAEEWTLIQEFKTSNSATDEHSYIYVAKGLSFHEPHPDEDEQLEIRKIPFQKLYEMVMSGEIEDSLTVIAVLKTKILIDKGEI